MKITDYIKSVFGDLIEDRKAKHKQKMLIHTDDDQMVVEALPLDSDNSNIDIKAVVTNMDDPEEMAKVVENNIHEIIKQDNVRDILLHLKDDDIAAILEQNQDVLRKQKKIRNAIEAIANNEKKLRELFKNISYITDLELARILGTLRPEPTLQRSEMIEQQKIKVVSMKILEHMVKHGGAWHIGELTSTFKETSKLGVLDLCLMTLKGYNEEKKGNITSKAKTKLAVDLLRLTKIDASVKFKVLDKYTEDELLTPDENAEVKLQMEKERLKMEETERERQKKDMKDNERI